MRRTILPAAAVVTALVIGGGIGIAAQPMSSGAVNKQGYAVRTTSASTTSTSFRELAGLRVSTCSLGPTSITVSASFSRAADVRVVDRAYVSDGPARRTVAAPGSVRFDAGRQSFTFVNDATAPEALNSHVYLVEYRAASGTGTTFHKGDINVVYHDPEDCA